MQEGPQCQAQQVLVHHQRPVQGLLHFRTTRGPDTPGGRAPTQARLRLDTRQDTARRASSAMHGNPTPVEAAWPLRRAFPHCCRGLGPQPRGRPRPARAPWSGRCRHKSESSEAGVCVFSGRPNRTTEGDWKNWSNTGHHLEAPLLSCQGTLPGGLLNNASSS